MFRNHAQKQQEKTMKIEWNSVKMHFWPSLFVWKHNVCWTRFLNFRKVSFPIEKLSVFAKWKRVQQTMVLDSLNWCQKWFPAKSQLIFISFESFPIANSGNLKCYLVTMKTTISGRQKTLKCQKTQLPSLCTQLPTLCTELPTRNSLPYVRRKGWGGGFCLSPPRPPCPFLLRLL